VSPRQIGSWLTRHSPIEKESNMIWFKNALIYQLADTAELNMDQWETDMAKHLYAPCLQQQPVSLGWVPAIPDTESLVHVSGAFALMCLQRQERLLPTTVVREVLAEKVAQLQQDEDRRVGSKERQTLKDEVIFSLLPRAFVRTTRHYLYVDIQNRLLVVDAASEKRADEVTGTLREALGTLPMTLFQSHCLPAPVLTQWVKDSEAVPAEWELQPDLEMTQSSNSDIKIRLRNLELDSEAVATHLQEDGQVVAIAFDWKERVQALVNAKAQLKRIRFADLITEQAFDAGGDDKIQQMDASFTLMASELSALMKDMKVHFNLAVDA